MVLVGSPGVRAGIVSAASVQIAIVTSAPDDHLAAGPNGRVAFSRHGRIRGAVAVQVSVLGLYRSQCSKG